MGFPSEKLHYFSRTSVALSALCITLIAVCIEGYYLQKHLLDIYSAQESALISDRYGKEIALQQNKNGSYAIYTNIIPARFQTLLLEKEDRWFFYHPGINPWSTLQAALYQIGIGDRKASIPSTI